MNQLVALTFAVACLQFSAQATELADLWNDTNKIQKLADDFGFGEGPAWHPDEQAVYFSDLKNKTIHRWSAEDGISTVRQGDETFANGIVIDPEGRLIFCETGEFRIVRREKDGSETVLADELDGRKLGMTNDLWMAPNGDLYFTIPNKKTKKMGDEARVVGAIVLLTRDGETRNVGEAVQVKAPNGIVGSRDGKRLYFRDGGACRMAEIHPDGSLTNPKMIADKGTDGLTLDEKGNLYTTSKNGIDIFGPDGTHLGLIPVPEPVANLTFGGADGRTLFITARTGFYSVKMKIKGDAFSEPTGSVHEPTGSVREPPHFVGSFLEKHCFECHDDVTDEGNLNLLDLAFSPEEPENLERWIAVLDRVESSEMPPKDEPQPTKNDRGTFLTSLSPPLLQADQDRIAQLGRGRIRRLNRSEFETALSDLFQIPLSIQKELPEDAKSHGFDTVGEALNVSSVQMEAYLEVIDQVLDEATTLYEKPKRRKHRLTYREEVGIMQVYRKGGPFLIQDDGVAFFATEKFSHLNACLSQFTAPHKARYQVEVSAYALRSEEPVILSLRAGGVGHAESNHVPHIFLKHMPVKEGEPQGFEWDGWLERGHFFRVYPTSLPPMRFEGKDEQMRQAEYEGPAAVVRWVEVDGPIFDDWPPTSHRVLWGDLAMEPLPHADPNKDPIEHLDAPPSKIAKPRLTRVDPNEKTGNKFVYDPKKQKIGGEPIHRAAQIPGELRPTFRLISTDPKKDSERLLRDFADRAFRRKADDQEVEPIIALVHRWLGEGRDFESAMRIGFKAILTSPGFLYHQGSLPTDSPMLSQTALAERLAFFLWNGLPDDELRNAAEEGDLADKKELRRQTARMLSDPKSDRFLKAFVGLWLDQRLIDFTTPDEKLYPEFDQLLQWSMVEETKAFVRQLVDEDLPTSNVIDSDFAMVNWRLANHYGLPSVDGMEVRSVKLPANSVRGGLMTQGSVLKVTANGTTTSPVVRGTWLLERIMGITPKPPPPGVPAIEPDIRGATTVREQLEKHRESESCATCHAEIDPPGLALESFDVIGGWRKNYRALNDELAEVREKFTWKRRTPIRYVEGPPVDSADVMPDGRPFEDINDFKALLLDDPRQIARGIVEKLVIYATGAEVSFADRQEVEVILDRAESTDFGFRTLIQEVVQSSLFARK